MLFFVYELNIDSRMKPFKHQYNCCKNTNFFDRASILCVFFNKNCCIHENIAYSSDCDKQLDWDQTQYSSMNLVYWLYSKLLRNFT